MTQPGSIGSQIPWRDESDLARELSDLRRRVAQLESTRLGTNGLVVSGPPGITVQGGGGVTVAGGGSIAAESGSSIVVDPGGVIRSADFNGDIDALTPGTLGWALGGLLNGAVLNQLSLPNGIIGNDALANPVTFDQSGNYTNTNAYGTTPGAVVTACTITVPAGFTECMLLTSMIVQGTNVGGAADNLWCQVSVPGVGASATMLMGSQAGFATACWNYYNVRVTGLAGGSVLTINGLGWTQVNPWGAGLNSATINAAAIFRR